MGIDLGGIKHVGSWTNYGMLRESKEIEKGHHDNGRESISVKGSNI